MIEGFLIGAIAFVCAVWYLQHRRRRMQLAARLHDPPGLELLAQRYARGEISRDEYLQKRGDILAHPLEGDRRVA